MSDDDGYEPLSSIGIDWGYMDCQAHAKYRWTGAGYQLEELSHFSWNLPPSLMEKLMQETEEISATEDRAYAEKVLDRILVLRWELSAEPWADANGKVTPTGLCTQGGQFRLTTHRTHEGRIVAITHRSGRVVARFRDALAVRAHNFVERTAAKLAMDALDALVCLQDD